MSTELWLPSPRTATPQDGSELAIKVSRMAVRLTRPSDEVRRSLRPTYQVDADAPIAATDDYWRSAKGPA